MRLQRRGDAIATVGDGLADIVMCDVVDHERLMSILPTRAYARRQARPVHLRLVVLIYAEGLTNLLGRPLARFFKGFQQAPPHAIVGPRIRVDETALGVTMRAIGLNAFLDHLRRERNCHLAAFGETWFNLHGRRRGLGDPREIYQCGADKLNDVLNWCAELGIAAVTLWVFSTENLKRSPGEVSGILSAIEVKIAALAHDSFMHEKRIRVQAIGRLDILPESVVAAIRAAEAATAQHDSMTLTIAAAYGGREEIVDAVCKFLKAQAQQGASLPDVIKSLTSDAIGRHLYAADLPDPDLIIRTSGEIRLSGFLLWQSVHSEFYFTDVLWPAFRKIDFLRAIRAYQGRNRRFGR